MLGERDERRRGYTASPFVVRLSAQDRTRPVQLLRERQASKLVRKRHGRQREALLCAREHRVIESERPAYHPCDAS